MKYFRITLLFIAAFAITARSQTVTPVTPVIANGQVQITVPDSSGGSHVVTFPVTAITSLSVGSGTDSYTAPIPTAVTSVQVACSPTALKPSATSQCNATVQGTGSFSSAVTLSASSGSVTTSGLFTASALAGTATVTATSTEDVTKSGTATITVAVPSNGAPVIPTNAIAVDLINPVTAWKNTKDAGTPGTATFSNNFPVSGIFFDDAGKSIDTRAFSIAYTGAGGVRFSNSFAKDTTSTHFVYDTTVQSADWPHVANLELDLNQVKADGRTAILGVQCSVYSHTWEVTLNKTDNSGWHWVPSNVTCNTPKWTPAVPHHIRIFGVLATTGIATYEGVEYDGVYSTFTNQTGLTARPLGWGIGSVLPNFQIDGLGTSGSATIYSDRLTIIRW